MLQVFVDLRLEQAKAVRPPCGCGRPTRVLRGSDWTRQTMLGTVELHGVYVRCTPCSIGSRPLHAWLGTDREVWSLDVHAVAVDLAADESCAQAVAKLTIDAKLGQALESAAREGQRSGGVAELEVEFDGGGIPVATLEPVAPDGEEPGLTPVRKLPRRHKDCRWEEVSAGSAQKPGEVGRLHSLRPTDALDESVDDLLALACPKGWTEATRVRGLADGARHIRPRMAETFHASEFRSILDRPHCRHHLS